MALIEVADFTHRALNRERFVYIVSFDVAGALDSVSHKRIMDSLRAPEIDAY